MIYIIVFLFLLATFLAIIKIEPFYKELIFLSFGLLLILIAAFRGEGVDRDYLNYVSVYLQTDPDVVFPEPSFALIGYIGRTLLGGNLIFLFFTYALIGISLKFYAIHQLSDYWFLSILVYLSYIFSLQDLTQIRVGAATAFLLLSIKPAYERNLWKFVLCVVLASLFHMSAIVISIIWFLDTKSINKFFYAAFIFLSYVLYFLLGRYFTDLIQLINIASLSGKIKAYAEDNDAFLNVFNVWQLLRCSVSLLLLWKIDLIVEKNKYAILLTKLYIVSTCIFVLLANNPSFSGRLSDIFAVGDIILLPCLVNIFKPKIIGFILVVCIAFSYLFLNLFYIKIIR